mgnify:CR=1 FL=1
MMYIYKVNDTLSNEKAFCTFSTVIRLYYLC